MRPCRGPDLDSEASGAADRSEALALRGESLEGAGVGLLDAWSISQMLAMLGSPSPYTSPYPSVVNGLLLRKKSLLECSEKSSMAGRYAYAR